MDLLQALGAVKVQTVPLDVEGLSGPERALLPEWIADHWRQRREAQERADKEAKAKRGK